MIILRKKIHWLFGFSVFLSFILYQSITTIPEGHMGLLLPVMGLANHTQSTQNLILKPGLHFKVPFFMRSIMLDNRLQTLVFTEASDGNDSQNIPTIDYYAHWHISDPVRYYQQTKNNFQQIKLLISQQIISLLNDKYNHITFNQLILHGGLSMQLDSALSVANKQLKSAGIRLVDIGFKQLHLSAEANARLLDSMSSEQENIAIALHADGKANAELIHANADNSVSLILAKAKEEAATIRAQGDAEAAKIYNKAYNKNPEFAAFYINLQAYQKGFNQSSMNNFLLFNTKDELLKLEKSHVSKRQA